MIPSGLPECNDYNQILCRVRACALRQHWQLQRCVGAVTDLHSFFHSFQPARTHTRTHARKQARACDSMIGPSSAAAILELTAQEELRDIMQSRPVLAGRLRVILHAQQAGVPPRVAAGVGRAANRVRRARTLRAPAFLVRARGGQAPVCLACSAHVRLAPHQDLLRTKHCRLRKQARKPLLHQPLRLRSKRWTAALTRSGASWTRRTRVHQLPRQALAVVGRTSTTRTTSAATHGTAGAGTIGGRGATPACAIGGTSQTGRQARHPRAQQWSPASI